MIPDLIDLGSPTPWPVLPPGIFDASLAEISTMFGTTPHRQHLFDGFVRLTKALELAGSPRLYLNGSFVTGKPHPEDYDGCWDPTGVDFSVLDPVLLRFENKREAQKLKFLGEMFPDGIEASTGLTWTNFFQNEKYSGRKKGILRVALATSKAIP